jgi:hypothetical protein
MRWTEIDQKTGIPGFPDRDFSSFAAANPIESRFIHLTPTGKNVYGKDCIPLDDVEFFESLSQ